MTECQHEFVENRVVKVEVSKYAYQRWQEYYCMKCLGQRFRLISTFNTYTGKTERHDGKTIVETLPT